MPERTLLPPDNRGVARLLLVLAFTFVAYSAHIQYRREGEAGTLFRGAALETTVEALRASHEHALEELVTVMREQHPEPREVLLRHLVVGGSLAQQLRRHGLLAPLQSRQV